MSYIVHQKNKKTGVTYVYEARSYWDNQFRLLLSSMAYTLLEALWRCTLSGTELEKSYCGTIRLKLLKIGAIITPRLFGKS